MTLGKWGASAALIALLSGCSWDEATSSSATAGAPAFNRAPDGSSTLACRSRSSRYPWSRTALRTWTPRAAVEPEEPFASSGAANGAPFSARLVQAYSEDYGEARRTVVLEMEDGCRRQFRAESFSDADRAVIDAAVDAHPSEPDPASYRLVYRPDMSPEDAVRRGELAVHTTQHFAIWYGKKTQGAFYKSISDQGRSMEQVLQESGEWLEKQWLINRDVINAPMPYAKDSDRRKLDIFLCGTGRPNPWDDDLQECGAHAAETMSVSAWGVNKGSATLVHEFGHMIQFYSGGFRDRGEAGVIWETIAEGNSYRVNPTIGSFFWDYLNQLENGFLFSPARYGAHPFITYLFEKDETRSLMWGTWERNLRDANGASQEDYLPAFVRLAKEDGIYPNGFASFADDAGWYGARLVAMDFLNQRAMSDVLRATRTSTWLGHFYTPLTRVATTGDPTLFTPPAKRPLLQWGTHIVPLTPSGQQVKVTLTGGTIANQAAWRFTLVAVDAKGAPTYAPLAAVVGKTSATATMKPPVGTKLYLAVTATPYAYETLGWQENGKPIRGTRFPYRVKIEGATPLTGPAEACGADHVPGAWTSNYTLSNNNEAGRPCD